MTDPRMFFGHRRAGVLAHPTSLPGDGLRAALDPDAYRFIDFLSHAGFSVWQMLPVGPVGASRSPYQALSVFAGNTALLPATTDGSSDAGYQDFVEAQAYWLEDFALYSAVKEAEGDKPWYDWPEALRDRDMEAMDRYRSGLMTRLEQIRREQYRFFATWRRLRRYAHAAGVYLFGDVAMFAAHDSADVWAHRDLFHLTDSGRIAQAAGAPPDAYASGGQNWGCPQYRWDRLARDRYRWWIERLRIQASLFDLLRLDHFRGLEASWCIPADRAAAEGHWEPVPGEALLAAARESLGPLTLVAEDLGHITPAVQALRARLNLPGMHVLQFAFDGDADNPHLPHNHMDFGVVYTGTHDNDTTSGWWRSLDGATRERALAYLDFPQEPMPWPLVRAALASVCSLAILPLQDCLGLGSEARMNTPARAEGNWSWRCPGQVLDRVLQRKFSELLRLYGRDG